MGTINKNIRDIRTFDEFRDAQQDEVFLGWLKYEDAAFSLEEGFDRAPELPYLPFNGEGLKAAEKMATSLWGHSDQAYVDDSLKLSQRFAYYIGEVFRRSFEGTWMNCPPHPQYPNDKGSGPVVDLPFRAMFLNPNRQFMNAINRRTEKEWSFVYKYATEDYDKWVAAGRPERVLD